VDGTIAGDLATGALPRRVKANRSDKRCTPLARPNPAAAAARRAGPYAERLALQRVIVGH
jgi:hypothetical protein